MADATQPQTQPQTSPDKAPEKAPEKARKSLPNLKDPSTAAFLDAAQSHIQHVKGKPSFVNKFCETEGCGYPKVPRSQFSGDRNHTDLVCSWDPTHTDPKFTYPKR